MASIQFSPADRVRVLDSQFPTYWANGAYGTIASPPAAVVHLAGGWSDHVRMVSTTTEVRPYYWVVLDEQGFDEDGDGPYSEAEIAGTSLHPVVGH